MKLFTSVDVKIGRYSQQNKRIRISNIVTYMLLLLRINNKENKKNSFFQRDLLDRMGE
jgi:hypothetical protein